MHASKPDPAAVRFRALGPTGLVVITTSAFAVAVTLGMWVEQKAAPGAAAAIQRTEPAHASSAVRPPVSPETALAKTDATQSVAIEGPPPVAPEAPPAAQNPIAPTAERKPPESAGARMTTKVVVAAAPTSQSSRTPKASRAAAIERFGIPDPKPEQPECYSLPNDAWFALAALSADEPSGEPAHGAKLCATDRSLNTAVTWARSPAEAAEQASRDNKLVFLIHVSGNFEDPGFT